MPFLISKYKMDPIERAVRNRNDGFKILTLWKTDSTIKYPFNSDTEDQVFYIAIEKVKPERAKDIDHPMLMCLYNAMALVVDWFPLNGLLNGDDYEDRINEITKLYSIDSYEFNKYKLQAMLGN